MSRVGKDGVIKKAPARIRKNPRPAGESAFDQEYFSRADIAKIFGVSFGTVKRWERKGWIVRTVLGPDDVPHDLKTGGWGRRDPEFARRMASAQIVRFHLRELSKIAATVYGDPLLADPESVACTCRCAQHRPPGPLDGIAERIRRGRAWKVESDHSPP